MEVAIIGAVNSLAQALAKLVAAATEVNRQLTVRKWNLLRLQALQGRLDLLRRVLLQHPSQADSPSVKCLELSLKRCEKVVSQELKKREAQLASANGHGGKSRWQRLTAQLGVWVGAGLSATLGNRLTWVLEEAEEAIKGTLSTLDESKNLEDAMARLHWRGGTRVTKKLPPAYQRHEDAFKQVLESLETPLPTIIEGLFGIGKTSLATDVAVHLLGNDDFKKRVFWLDFGSGFQRSEKQMTEEIFMAELLKKQGTFYQDLTLQAPDRLRDVSNAQAILKSTIAEAVVLILDNVWDGGIIAAFDLGEQVKLFVTTRRSGQAMYGDCVPVMLTPENSPFNVAANAELLLAEHAGLPGSEIPAELQTSADGLLERCSKHPLIIAIVGRTLRTRQRGMDEHGRNKCWSDFQLEFATAIPTKRPPQQVYELTVYAAIKLSAESSTEQAQAVLSAFGAFKGKATIGKDILTWWASTKYADKLSDSRVVHAGMAELVDANLAYEGHFNYLYSLFDAVASHQLSQAEMQLMHQEFQKAAFRPNADLSGDLLRRELASAGTELDVHWSAIVAHCMFQYVLSEGLASYVRKKCHISGDKLDDLIKRCKQQDEAGPALHAAMVAGLTADLSFLEDICLHLLPRDHCYVTSLARYRACSREDIDKSMKVLSVMGEV